MMASILKFFEKIVWPLSIIVFVSFVVFVATLAVSNPLCCADDASIAIVSKNLASGLGYFSMVNYWGAGADYMGMLFDPAISTGAASVLPVALGIFLFGPSAAVPGLVHVAMYTSLISSFILILYSLTGKTVTGSILIGFVLLILSTGAYHFEQWHAQLGEVLAALLIILGAALLSLKKPGYKVYFVAGLLIGASILAKLLAALYVGMVILVLIVALFREPQSSKLFRFQILVIFFVGTCVPITLFELWKLFSFGFDGWLANWSHFLKFVMDEGIHVDSIAEPTQLLSHRWSSIHQRFFIPLVAITMLVISYPFVATALPRKLRFFSIILLSGFVLHVAYWIFISNGKARYIYIAIVIGCLLISVAQGASKSTFARGVLGISYVMIVVAGLPKMDYRIANIDNNLIQTRSTMIVADYIEARHPQEKIHTQWWAHTAALEYLSLMPHRYSNWNEPRNRLAADRLVISNSKFLQPNDIEYIEFLKSNCEEELAYGSYKLYQCSKYSDG
ncbi:hypothetical protein ACFL17_06660 [Pseudomonadota bacterium]